MFSLFLLLFSSCENFLDGDILKKEIDSAVEYANAPSYTIQIAADEGTGKFTIGEGEKSVKATDTFRVGFQKKANYKFVKWAAVSKTDDNLSRSECVSFEDESALETNVKILKGNDDIRIKPLCELVMDFTSCIPVNNTKSGIERNSQIDLTFTNPLSENNDVSKIEITIEDTNTNEIKDGKLYFQTPEIKDNKLLVKSVKDNLIPVEIDELKIVRITLPSDFKYIGAGNEEKEIGSEMSYYYTVNYQTCDKLHVVFGVTKDDGGKFKVKNIYDESVSLNYSLGEIDTIIFKPATGYKFIGWEYENDGHIQLDNANEVINGSTYENGYCSEDNSYAVKIEIFNSSNEDTNFLFKANVQEIPTAKIQITSEYGRISPNGIANYKEGDKVNLFFTADSDYQFIRWRLVDKKTGKEIENQEYVKFEEDEEFNTNFTFDKANEEIEFLIEPYCEVRPTVVSVSSLYSTEKYIKLYKNRQKL